MGVNSKGAEKKFAIAQTEFARVLPMFIADAAQWVSFRLRSEILNGEGGSDYPKSYPGAVSPGAKGFVGIETSNLRNSITPKRKKLFEWLVSQTNEAIAPYHDHVINWSKGKYGKNFYEITVTLYGPKFIKEYAQLLKDYEKAIEQKRKFNYSNPFPA